MAGKSNSKRTVRGAEKQAKTIRKRQDTVKKQLLEVLEESPNLGQALTRVGIDRTTYWRWKQDDPMFALNANNAMWNGREKMADMVELALLGIARDGNVRAIKLYLEHNHPRYIRYGRFDVPETEKGLSLEQQAAITRALKNWTTKHAGGDDRFIKS